MDETRITTTLRRLRAAADRTLIAWPTMRWTKIEGSGPDELQLSGDGNFDRPQLEPGRDLVLRHDLEAPIEAVGVGLEGDALELTVFSIYPTDLRWNGAPIFSDASPPVAAGPALVTVVPSLMLGGNGTLELRIRVPDNQTTPWVHLRFTTPRLRARFELLDVAWSQLALCDALAASSEDDAILERAAAHVAAHLPEELISGDTATLERALSAMETTLEPFAERVRALSVHVIGHSHIDMNWLWTWPDTVSVIRRDFHNVLALMDEYPELTFTHSQPATYEVIRVLEPDLLERVKAHIQSGRWEAATLTWLEGDTNMAGSEALARQFLEGVTFSREVLGVTPSTFILPDNFGHAGNLPQLAVSAGTRRFYHHRANPGGTNLWPAYWWEGQDGTRMLATSTHTYNGDIRARDLAETAIRAQHHGQRSSLHFHGIGDHVGGPARQNLEALRRFQDRVLLPTARHSSLEAYTKELLEAGGTLPGHHGEMNTLFEGCYTTHADTKTRNRARENLLVTADTLAALAGRDEAARLRGPWRSTLFNHFHDILDGSAIHEAYEKDQTDFEEVRAAAETVIHDALEVLEAGLPAGRIAVTNPLGWAREDWVTVPGLTGEGAVWLEDEYGQRAVGQYTAEGLGFVARVPAFSTVGYAILEARDGLPAALEAVGAFAPTDNRETNLLGAAAVEPPYLQLETDCFRAYLRRDCGIIVSFVDKRVNRDLVGFGMRRGSDYLDSARPDLALNVFQITEERPHGMSAWQYHEVWREESLLSGATTTVLEHGPARLVLEVRHQLRASHIRQTITFYRELARVDFEAELDWRELGGPEQGVPNLKLAFTAKQLECQAWFETPFGAARRAADGQETPALRWVDVGGPDYGVALLNDNRYGHDVLGNRMRLTLVRSAYEPDAISDVGTHRVRCALVPHPGDWREAGITRAGAGFNQPLIARVTRASAAACEVWRPRLTRDSSVVIAGLKAAHDGSGRVIRLYESAGQTVETELEGLPDHARVWEVSIVEDRLDVLQVERGRLSLTFRPWQVRTLLVETAH